MANVLLIEDDDDLRNMLAMTLETAGYSVTGAREGNEALSEIENKRPDIIVCDIIMDGMEGISAIMAFRRELGDVPIIAMSGNEFYLKSSEKLGANITLLKPFTRIDFLSEVETLLNRPVSDFSTTP